MVPRAVPVLPLRAEIESVSIEPLRVASKCRVLTPETLAKLWVMIVAGSETGVPAGF